MSLNPFIKTESIAAGDCNEQVTDEMNLIWKADIKVDSQEFSDVNDGQGSYDEEMVSVSNEIYVKEEPSCSSLECDQKCDEGTMNETNLIAKADIKVDSEDICQENYDEEMISVSDEIYVKEEASCSSLESNKINRDAPKTIEDHNLGVSQRDDKRFKCGYCDFQTAYSNSLKVHSRKHTGEMLQCQHCDYTTARSSELKVHSRKHTGERFQCQHCDFTTVRSDYLKAHSRKHTGEMLQCQLCDYTTTKPRKLQKHSRKHIGGKLQCQHCDYTTTLYFRFKAHSRKHAVEMLQCQHCDYTTNKSNNLKDHSLIHTEEHTGVSTPPFNYKILYEGVEPTRQGLQYIAV